MAVTGLTSTTNNGIIEIPAQTLTAGTIASVTNESVNVLGSLSTNNTTAQITIQDSVVRVADIANVITIGGGTNSKISIINSQIIANLNSVRRNILFTELRGASVIATKQSAAGNLFLYTSAGNKAVIDAMNGRPTIFDGIYVHELDGVPLIYRNAIYRNCGLNILNWNTGNLSLRDISFGSGTTTVNNYVGADGVTYNTFDAWLGGSSATNSFVFYDCVINLSKIAIQSVYPTGSEKVFKYFSRSEKYVSNNVGINGLNIKFIPTAKIGQTNTTSPQTEFNLTTDANGLTSTAKVDLCIESTVVIDGSDATGISEPPSNRKRNLKKITWQRKIRHYLYISQDEDVTPVSKTGDTGNEILKSLTLHNNITLTEAQALALTGIAIAKTSASVCTITLTQNRTVAEVWQYYRAWISQLANFDTNDIVTFDGTTLNIGGWNVVGANFLINGKINSTGNITASSPLQAGVEVEANVVTLAGTNIAKASATTQITGLSTTGNISTGGKLGLGLNSTINATGNLVISNTELSGTLTINTNTDIALTLTSCTGQLTAINRTGTGNVIVNIGGTTALSMIGTLGVGVTSQVGVSFVADVPFTIYAMNETTNGRIGYEENTQNALFGVPVGTQVKVAAYAVGYKVAYATIDTTTGGSITTFNFVEDTTFNQALDVASILAGLEDTITNNDEFNLTFTQPLVLDIEYMRAFINRLQSRENYLRCVLLNSGNILATEKDEITVRKPKLFLLAGTQLTTQQRVELNGFFNTLEAKAITPSYVINPSNASGKFIQYLTVKPTIDYVLISNGVKTILNPDLEIIKTETNKIEGVKTDVTTIKTKTDKLEFVTETVNDVEVNRVKTIDKNSSDIKAKTDKLEFVTETVNDVEVNRVKTIDKNSDEIKTETAKIEGIKTNVASNKVKIDKLSFENVTENEVTFDRLKVLDKNSEVIKSDAASIKTISEKFEFVTADESGTDVTRVKTLDKNTADILAKTNKLTFDANDAVKVDKTGYTLTTPQVEAIRTEIEKEGSLVNAINEKTKLLSIDVENNVKVDFSGVDSKLDEAKEILDKLEFDPNQVLIARLTDGQVIDIADEVEKQIIDETDTEKVLQAIKDKIGNVNIDEAALVVAIRNELERNAGLLKAVKDKVDTLENTSMDGIAQESSVQEVKEKVSKTLTKAQYLSL